MSKTPTNAAAAKRLGIPEDEVRAVSVEDAGLVVTTTDGQTYIDVPEDQPDANGKTGLMFLVAPSQTYNGSFPVFGQHDPDNPVQAPGVLPSADHPEPAASTFDWTGATADEIVAHVGDDPELVAAAIGFEAVRKGADRKAIAALSGHLTTLLDESD